MVSQMNGIADGDILCEKLLGKFRTTTSESIPLAIRMAEEEIVVGRASAAGAQARPTS